MIGKRPKGGDAARSTAWRGWRHVLAHGPVEHAAEMEAAHLRGLFQGDVKQASACGDDCRIVAADVGLQGSARSRTVERGRLHKWEFDQIEARLACSLD